MGRKVFTALLAALLIPYIVTLAWTGTIEGREAPPDLTSGKRVLLDRGTSNSYLDVEEYLVGVVARQVPPDYGEEVLKAQAIIARTYIYKEMGGGAEIPESALDMDYLEEGQLKKLWGEAHFIEYYQSIEKAVEATKGTAITCDGAYIDPLFCRASSGRTRTGDENHPYLQPADSPRDVEADDFLKVTSWSKEEFADRINSIQNGGLVTVDQLPQSIQLVSRDDSGYVEQIQIGTKAYTGEEVQAALGLQSPDFTLEEYDGMIRAVTKGIGHGYGFSQYGAKCLAEDGRTAEETLAYFYKNIVLISE